MRKQCLLWRRWLVAEEKSLPFAINEAAYGKMAEVALREYGYAALLFEGEHLPAKPLTRRQKISRSFKRIKQSFIQKIHDWTQKNGAYCDSDW